MGAPDVRFAQDGLAMVTSVGGSSDVTKVRRPQDAAGAEQ